MKQMWNSFSLLLTLVWMPFHAPIPFLLGNDSAPSLPTLTLFVVNLKHTIGSTEIHKRHWGKIKSSKSGLSGWSASRVLGVSRQSSLDATPSFYDFISHSALEDGYLQMDIQMHTTRLPGDHGFNFNAFLGCSDNTIWGGFFPLILPLVSSEFKNLNFFVLHAISACYAF